MKKSLIIVLLVAIVVSSLFAINAGIPFVESGVLIPVWGGEIFTGSLMYFLS